jgi:hypothetical protein
MSAGLVLGKIILDQPSKYHCGPSDPVTGYIALTYYSRSKRSDSNSNDLQSLFGPLKIFAEFTGRAKTKIHKSNGNTSSTHRGRAPLFAQHHKIYDGSYHSKSGECVRFPFSFNFPDSSQHMPGQGDFRQDPRFHEEAGGPLPPTFTTKNRGFSKDFVAFVEYRIGASMRMPGIDVEIRGLDCEETRPVVLYEQPPPPVAEMFQQKTRQYSDTVNLKNENLLPEDDRPSGFRQKTKFMFSSQQYPTYMFDIISTVPAEIFIGQPLVFELSVHPNIKQCTAPLPPQIELVSFFASLKSRVEIRAEYGFLSAEEAHKSDRLPSMSTQILDKEVPFCKANDHKKVIRTRPLSGVQSSFSTYNICQRYTLEVEYIILAAGKYKKFKREVPITIHGPTHDGSTADFPAMPGNAEQIEASSSSTAAAAAASRGSPDLNPLLTTSDHATVLPEYERPPEYDVVLDSTTENDEPRDSGLGKGKAPVI